MLLQLSQSRHFPSLPFLSILTCFHTHLWHRSGRCAAGGSRYFLQSERQLLLLWFKYSLLLFPPFHLVLVFLSLPLNVTVVWIELPCCHGWEELHLPGTIDAINGLFCNRHKFFALGRRNLGSIESEHFRPLVTNVALTLAFNRRPRVHLHNAHTRPGSKSLKTFLTRTYFASVTEVVFDEESPYEISNDHRVVDA